MRKHLTIFTLVCSAVLAGCGRQAAQSAQDPLAADVFREYLARDPSAGYSGAVSQVGQQRYARLATALQAALDRHPAAPQATRNTVRELQQLAAKVADLYAVVGRQMQPGVIPPQWQEAQRLTAEFESRIRTLPGAETALAPAAPPAE